MKPDHRVSIVVLLVTLVALVVGARGAPGAAAESDDPVITQSALAPSSALANAGWEEIGAGSASGGGISRNKGMSELPAIKIAEGMPVVAWSDDSDGNFEISVLRWNGLVWKDLGRANISGNDGTSTMPSLAVSPDGSIIVTWADDTTGDFEIYVRRWNGSTWAELGDNSAVGGGISDNDGSSGYPSLAITSDGTPMIVWMDNSSGNFEIYARIFNGTEWVEMGIGSATAGGISNNSGYSGSPYLAIDADNTPLVAWYDYSGILDFEIYVLSWNGSEWVEVGEGSATGGGISNNSSDSGVPRIAIAPDGFPIIAWADTSSGGIEIYVRRWNGTTWAEVGAGSATGGGISNNPGISDYPWLAIGPDGAPVVAWQDDNSGNDEIYVRRWNGTAWVEIGPGSATHGGISNNSGVSNLPSLAIDIDNNPSVAWMDNSVDDFEIYFRRYNPNAPICYTLVRDHTGEGNNPIATPANSTGCAAGQYTAGQTISLTAAPTFGHRVKSWNGTANNASTATTNSLTMPASTHTVSVTYEPIPTITYRAFMPAALDMPQICWPGPHETASNDDQANADGPLCSGLTYTGDPDDQYDVFFFESKAAGPISVRLDNHAGGGVQLSLLDSAFTLIDRDFEPAGGYRLDLANQPPGRYYVVVHAAEPKPGSTTRYTLRATFPANP